MSGDNKNGFDGIGRAAVPAASAGRSYGGQKMEKIGSYYRSSIYDRTAQAAKEAENAKADRARNANAAKDEKKSPTLSRAAQKLLKELQKTYKNMDIMVADYETDEEAAALLSRGTAEYSALLSTDELEKMAADESVKEKNLKTLDEAVSKLDEMKEQLGDKAEDVTRIGITVGDDGEVSFFAELEKNSEKQRERMEKEHSIEKQREDKRDEAREAKNAETAQYRALGKPAEKRTTVFAPTVEELAEKISQVDWSKVKEERPDFAGQKFDFMV
ncbi:MAG TPA: hypothetical protein DCZ91_12880 [Lachnospiraceae bacterium]|nr:hypothetical protein [Lachnospiraceae bacterium]